MSDQAKGGSFAQAHQEVTLWLVRTVLAALLAGLVWSARVAFGPTVDRLDWNRVMEMGRVASEETKTSNTVRREQRRLLDRANARADSISAKENFPGVLRLVGQSTLEPQITPLLRIFPSHAARDSAQAASLHALPLTAGLEQLVHAVEVALGRERRVWEILGRTFDPQSRGSRRARNDSTFQAVDAWLVAVEGALALEGRVGKADSVRLAKVTIEQDQLEDKLRSGLWKSAVVLGVFFVCCLALLSLSAYAFTGDIGYLRPWRKRTPQKPDKAG